MSQTAFRIVAVGVAAAGPAWGHHSLAMFDQQTHVTLQGVVKEFQWTNPHVFIQLLVPSADGTVEWSLEMHSPGTSMLRGWKRSSLRAGDAITVVIHPVRDGTPGGQVVAVHDRLGQPIPAETVP